MERRRCFLTDYTRDTRYGIQVRPLRLGPQTVNFRYRGVVNNSFSIVILPQQIIEINILQYPKLTYLYHIEDSLDLSGIRINKRYNDGLKDSSRV